MSAFEQLMHTGFPVIAPLVAVLVISWILNDKEERNRLNKP